MNSFSSKIIFLIIVVVGNFLYTSVNAGDFELFKKIIRQNPVVKSIDADIEQVIKNPGGDIEIFKGRYRADLSGRFRLDYVAPAEQIVLNNGKLMVWYYIADKLLYRFPGSNRGNNPGINPLYEFSSKMEQNYKLIYLGKQLYGFFSLSHQFLLEDKKSGNKIDIWINTKNRVVLAKIIRDRSGNEILKETYSNFKDISGIYFPLRVDVYAQTAKGIVRNTTYYKNVRLNIKLDNSIYKFNLPSDIEILDYSANK